MSDAYRRANMLGLDKQEMAKYQQEVDNYLKNVAGQDNRRLMWIFERAAGDLAAKINGYEAEYATAKVLGQTVREQELKAYIERYLADFKFLYSLYQITQLKVIENDVEDIAEWFQSQRKKNVKKK